MWVPTGQPIIPILSKILRAGGHGLRFRQVREGWGGMGTGQQVDRLNDRSGIFFGSPIQNPKLPTISAILLLMGTHLPTNPYPYPRWTDLSTCWVFMTRAKQTWGREAVLRTVWLEDGQIKRLWAGVDRILPSEANPFSSHQYYTSS